jgi:hypothetical protein
VSYDRLVTETVSSFRSPHLGTDELHYLGDDAAVVAGCSRKTLERRANKGTLTARYFHGLVCYPVTEIHTLRDELHGRAAAK